MLLITSAAYAAPELTAEFGHLPPAFLPVGNRRLFVHQVRSTARAGEPVYLSLPEDFSLDPMDQQRLAAEGVTVLPVPAGLSLGQSVVYALNVTPHRGRTVRILHGDTLIQDLPRDALDIVSVGEAQSYYRWTEHRTGSDGLPCFVYGLDSDRQVREVLSGYFAFSDAALLIAAITRAGGDFINGLTGYARTRGLKPVRTGSWFDFGSLHTSYQSRAVANTARAFNAVQITRRTVRKSSPHSGPFASKIAAETAWYQQLPPALRRFVPALLETHQHPPAYTLSHLYLPALNDLLVFGRLPPFVWRRILAALDEFLTACAQHRPPPALQPALCAAADRLVTDKTHQRLAAYCAASGIDPERPWSLNGQPLPGLRELCAAALARIPATTAATLGVSHGDLCFSNIFYDFRSETVRVVDPRGQDHQGNPSVWGDLRYDLAKLRHSLAGGYDFILAGAATCHRDARDPYALTLHLPDHPPLPALRQMLRDVRFAGESADTPAVRAMTVLLFVSMLPLHADDPVRQTALLANALRLFAEDLLPLDKSGPEELV